MKLLETLEQYKKDGWIKGQSHPNLPLTIWNYTPATQYEGKWDEVTTMCRGLVTHNFSGKVFARPFKKFFNLEENLHTPTTGFDVYEKMDGSLIILFNFYGEWIVASRGSFTSDQAVAAHKLLSDLNLEGLPTNYTYLFEIIY